MGRSRRSRFPRRLEYGHDADHAHPAACWPADRSGGDERGAHALAAAFRDVTPVGRPRHLLALYRIKTMENLELELTGEATNPHPGPVTAVTFARNGRMLASGGEDGSIAIWDVSDHLLVKPRATVTGLASHRVYALAFSNDWRYLAAVTWDKSKPNLLLIDVDTARPVRSLRLERQLTGVGGIPRATRS